MTTEYTTAIGDTNSQLEEAASLPFGDAETFAQAQIIATNYQTECLFSAIESQTEAIHEQTEAINKVAFEIGAASVGTGLIEEILKEINKSLGSISMVIEDGAQRL